MRITILVFAALFGGCYGIAIINAFSNNIDFALGTFIIGTFFAVFYLAYVISNN